MPVIRIEKTKNYTVMSNYHLKDKKLSFKAKGLLSYMLSLPNDWDYTIEGLSNSSKDNRSAIKTALQELKDNNYLQVNKILPNKSASGRIEYEYIVFEDPKTRADFLYLENLSLENRTLLNTNKLNTNKRKNKKKNFEANKTDADLNSLYEN